ncbi:MAG: hypothetical protein U0V74_08925 [Chitinophagales bacterium]
MGERKKRILFQLSFVAISCIIIEVVLRGMGYPPGDLRPNWLKLYPVDSLVLVHDFYTNDKGVLIADSNYWAKEKIHINKDGFRGKEFTELDSSKKKVLFIGDSFTWGMSASPFQDSSFCDILGRETNYEIINTGIPAADPTQYEEIAKEFVPALKPDYVVVVFFMGNDLMKWEREVIPGRQFYYWTNAGAILADIDGKHFNSAQEAYNYLVSDKYFLKNPAHWYEGIIAKSSLLSRLYAVRYRLQEKMEYNNLLKNTSITKNHLKGIVQLCDNAKVPLKFVLIPEYKEANMDTAAYRKQYADLLNDETLKNYWLITPTGKKLFKANPDGHLNNDGHRFYAALLKQFLASTIRN